MDSDDSSLGFDRVQLGSELRQKHCIRNVEFKAKAKNTRGTQLSKLQPLDKELELYVIHKSYELSTYVT